MHLKTFSVHERHEKTRKNRALQQISNSPNRFDCQDAILLFLFVYFVRFVDYGLFC